MKSRFFLRQMPQCSQAVLRIESYGYTTTNLRPREVTPGDLMMLKLYSGFGSFEILNSHLKKIRLAAVKKSLYGCKIRQGKCLLQDLCERLLAIYEMHVLMCTKLGVVNRCSSSSYQNIYLGIFPAHIVPHAAFGEVSHAF